MLIFFLRPSDHSTPIPDGVERPPHRKATIKSFHTAEKEERKWIFHPHKSPHRNHMKAWFSGYYTSYQKFTAEKGKLRLQNCPSALCLNNLSLPANAHEDHGIAPLSPRMMQDTHIHS